MEEKKSSRILVVDDDRDVLKSAKFYLKQHISRIDIEVDPNSIPSHLDQAVYDVVLLDMNFTESVSSGNEGFKWLKKIQKIDSAVSTVLITAYGDVKKAVRAVKMGATDFVLKPWKNEKLLATINAAIKLAKSQRKNDALHRRQKEINAQNTHSNQSMIGQSEALKKVFHEIEKVAPTSANVLITGENGTGKELVARALHRQSKRDEEAFINVDIGAISKSVFESEFFGHVKGAFTDAKRARPGRFEVAHGGTLFLDEIGNMPIELQSKLLKAVESRQVKRVGSNKPINVDIRLICATNETIENLSDENYFRQDLLYRINTVHMQLPSLREREGDIPLLVKSFINRYGKKYNKDIKGISQAALHKLKSYSWPGNIRELQHSVERAVIMVGAGYLKENSFFLSPVKSSNDPLNEGNYNLDDVEQSAIRKALDKHECNISKSAKELGISRAALYRRIEKYNIET